MFLLTGLLQFNIIKTLKAHEAVNSRGLRIYDDIKYVPTEVNLITNNNMVTVL